METLLQDLRYSMRMLFRSPGFTAVAVLTLALGIGANTAIFSVINAVLLRPLPYPDSARLVQVEELHQSSNGGTAAFSTAQMTYATFLDLAPSAGSLGQVSAYRPWTFNLTGHGEPESLSGVLVSANFFAALGTPALLGRTLAPADDQRGAPGAAVLSYGLWQRRFGSDRYIVGKLVQLNGQPDTVVGVMPAGFAFPESGFGLSVDSEVWSPLVASGPLANNRDAHLLTVIARLRPGVTLASACAEMATFAAHVGEANPGVDPGMGVTVENLHAHMVAPVRPALVVLLAAVGCVLLIACANLTNLLLAQGASRNKEMAIRVALGAGKLRLVRQLLTESILLAFSGGLTGLLLAVWAIDLCQGSTALSSIHPGEIHIEAAVLWFTLGLTMLCGVGVGLVPMRQAFRARLGESLHDSGRTSSCVARSRARELFVIAEVAAALVLLTSAGLLMGSFVALLQVPMGFQPENLLTLHLFLPTEQGREGNAHTIGVLHDILDRVRATPGVDSVGLVNSLPLTGGSSTGFHIEGRPLPKPEDEPEADVQIVDPNYFAAMRIPLLRGRWFSEADTPDAHKVMVINQTMAQRYWPHQDPIGQHVTMTGWGPPLTGEVVGVVGDVRVSGLDVDLQPEIHWPYTQFPSIFNALVVRTKGDPHSMATSVKAQIWSVVPDQTIASIRTMDEVLGERLAQRRLSMWLLAAFAALGLILAAVGIYGVMAHMVTQRTRELGIRLALGAQKGDVLRLVTVRGARLITWGVGLGLGMAILATRLMSSLLFRISPHDPFTLAGVSLLLSVVGLAACWIPARRAMRLDPMVALKHE